MERLVRVVLGTSLIALLVGGPWIYGHYRLAQSRNLRVVKEGVLYRSGQMTLAGLQGAIHDLGIRTVITLRDAATASESPPDRREEAYCKAEGIRYVRISPRSWWAPGGAPP